MQFAAFSRLKLGQVVRIRELTFTPQSVIVYATPKRPESRKGDSSMMNLANVRRNNAVAVSSQALNVFESFFSYAYFYFYFFYQTLLRSLTRPAAC